MSIEQKIIRAYIDIYECNGVVYATPLRMIKIAEELVTGRQNEANTVRDIWCRRQLYRESCIAILNRTSLVERLTSEHKFIRAWGMVEKK